MKLIKISDVHFIIVDDSEIKKDDWVCKNGNLNKAVRLDDIETSDKWKEVGWRKITHSTHPMPGVFPIPITIVKELIGEVDVEKKVYSIVEQVIGNHNMQTSTAKDMISVGISCYNQAIEDNKDKKYTEDDLRKAIQMARDIKDDSCHDVFTAEDVSGCTEVCTCGWRNRYKDEEIIQSIQPKTEWDVEFIDGKLKLK